jgi:hypothetical protein
MEKTMAQMKRTDRASAIAAGAALLAAWLGGAAPALAQAGAYPNAAPIADYRIASPADEIALARSAAPPSISGDAEILVLGAAGYETAVKGKNGFVCMVERAWFSDPDEPEFWNAKIRGPDCYNPAAARSVLPEYLERTRWVLAGASKAEIVLRTKAEIAAGRIGPPEIGAMGFMMSKGGFLGDKAGGHWHPHLMIFLPRGAKGSPDWGAGLPGSPVQGGGPGLDLTTVYFVPLVKWSDGTSSVMSM